MEVVGTLYGAAVVLKKIQASVTQSVVGVPQISSAGNAAGITIATTTSLAEAVGINYDTATYVTAQQTDGTSAERVLTVSINPDQMVRAFFSGSASTGAALTIRDVSTASTAGTAITTGDDWSSPTMDEGAVWGYDGANVGQLRKITSVSTTAATVTVPFDYDTVVGDNFLYAPVFPFRRGTVTLTTALTQVRQDIATATNTGAFQCIELFAGDIGAEGRTTSYMIGVFQNHILHPLA